MTRLPDGYATAFIDLRRRETLPLLATIALVLAGCGTSASSSGSSGGASSGRSTNATGTVGGGGASASTGSSGSGGVVASTRSTAASASTASGGVAGTAGSLGIGGSIAASTANGGTRGTDVSTGDSQGSGGRSSIANPASTGTSSVTGGGGRTGGLGGNTTATGGSTTGGGGVAGGSRTGGTASAAGGTISPETGGSRSATGGSSGTSTSTMGPCDIYEAGGAPCVAAHSTTRALYAAYNGKLYQVRRADKALLDIGVLSPGGIADASAQETFCANTKCTISRIYDQSPKKNDLTLTSGGWIGDRAKESDAFGIKIKLNGKTVYGIRITGETNMTGNGYRNNQAVGTAEGDAPESMYMVVNGKNFNDKCCFDYGNAERNSLNNGPGTMEAIYFGNCTAWGRGEGTGPWVMADLEEGLFSGKNRGLNPGVKSITADYVTAMLKGKPHTMAIKAGDSQAGPLTTVYEGAYPSGYDPMKKEGAIILGTGGDNSFAAVGDFFEGAMTAAYTTDSTDDAVQANIVAAGYGR